MKLKRETLLDQYRRDAAERRRAMESVKERDLDLMNNGVPIWVRHDENDLIDYLKDMEQN